MEKISELSELTRPQIWGMLNGVYGQPDTPEKRGRILYALNLGPGDPIPESEIWPDDPLGAGTPESVTDGPAA